MAAIEKQGIATEFVDAAGADLSTSDVEDLIENINPSIIGINVFSTNKEEVFRLINRFGNKARFVLGGAGVAGMVDQIMSKPSDCGIDVVQGDGEIIVPRLILDHAQVEVTAHYENNNYYKVDKNSPYYVQNIDDFKLNRSILLHEGLSLFEGQVEACIVATRGCIYNCAFCGSAFSRNKQMGIRKRSTDSIVNEIDSILTMNKDLELIRFVDDLFLRNEESILEAIKIFSNFPKLEWRAMAHINTFNGVSVETLKELRHSGCRELFIGIESGSEKILKKIHKTSNINIIKNVIHNISLAGIAIKTYFIYGFPGENEADGTMTYNLAKDLKGICVNNNSKYRASVFKFRPYDGTELADGIAQTKRTNEVVTTDQDLNDKVGNRAHFNFKRGNYSDCDDATLTDLVVKTMSLND